MSLVAGFRSTALALLTLTALLLLACGDDDEGRTSAEVFPFSEVQDGEIVFENDPTTPDRGIFRVTTTEPMICAIVWGETESLGNFNNSLAMNGTGIVDHNVFLPGARAGETYYYRVQGSTADGRLFQSELATFTLPAAEASSTPASTEELGENLAIGATVVDLSSEFSASWGGANALDGDVASEWSSAGDGDEAYITIDLGSVRELGAVEFVTRAMADGSAITSSFYLVVDGGERLGPFEAGTPASPAPQAIEVSGRELRFEVDESTGGNTGAVEIRAYGPPSE